MQISLTKLMILIGLSTFFFFGSTHAVEMGPSNNTSKQNTTYQNKCIRDILNL